MLASRLASCAATKASVARPSRAFAILVFTSGAVVRQLQVHAVGGALRSHHALQHVEGRLVCLVGEPRGQRALQAAAVRSHLPGCGGPKRLKGCEVAREKTCEKHLSRATSRRSWTTER